MVFCLTKKLLFKSIISYGCFTDLMYFYIIIRFLYVLNYLAHSLELFKHTCTMILSWCFMLVSHLMHQSFSLFCQYVNACPHISAHLTSQYGFFLYLNQSQSSCCFWPHRFFMCRAVDFDISDSSRGQRSATSFSHIWPASAERALRKASRSTKMSFCLSSMTRKNPKRRGQRSWLHHVQRARQTPVAASSALIRRKSDTRSSNNIWHWKTVRRHR